MRRSTRAYWHRRRSWWPTHWQGTPGYITHDAIATAADGMPVFLTQLWPETEAGEAAVRAGTEPCDVLNAYDEAEASAEWRALDAPGGARFPWDLASTYRRRPPFVRFASPDAAPGVLIKRGANPRDLNVYASRRGTWEVMLRAVHQPHRLQPPRGRAHGVRTVGRSAPRLAGGGPLRRRRLAYLRAVS